jgi:hypothetical protein
MFRSVTSRIVLLGAIFLIQFVVLEAGLRLYTESEGSSTFQSLFMDDERVGIRLRPGARIRYSTAEFTTDIAINAQGVRDEEPIGPKATNERRIVVLGDSLVLAVQVAQTETFCERLEQTLNARGGSERWRVINAGVQGYGPVQDWFFLDKIGATFQPDIVLIVAYVGNDAIEAAAGAAALEAGRPLEAERPNIRRVRRIVRSSIVLQSARVRWDQLRSRMTTGTPELPLATYLEHPPPVLADGLAATARAFGMIAARAEAIGARTAIALMPARFQVNDVDYANLNDTVRAAGGVLLRNSGSDRFREALQPLGLPLVDLQPALARQPDPTGLYFQRTAHLTPRGHEAVADAVLAFLDSAGLTRAGSPAR